jgi:hypothetical protein
MPANTITSLALDRVYSTTLQAVRDTVAMEIVQSNPLLWHMYRQGAVQYEGGTECRLPVVLTESSNVSAIGTYETFSTTPEDGPDTARYPTWYKNRASVIVDNTELSQNRGAYQIVNLLNAKMAIAKISMMNELSRQLFTSNAAAPKEIAGLPQFISSTGTGLTVGGIIQADYANWQNQSGTMTAFGTDGLDTWEQIYMDASKKSTHPDIILVDPRVYRFFKRLVAPNQAERDRALWDQGFQNLLFEGTPVVPEEQLTAGECYFLTTTGKRGVSDFNLKPEHFTTIGKNPLAAGKATGVGLQLGVLSNDDFRMTDFMTPPNSDVIMAHTYFTCMLTASSLARQGISTFTGTVQF